ncbi:MAG: thiamine pyrophosphate-binding protein [Actinomycetes bacterium]
MTQTVGAALAAALAEHGVDVVFGIPGTHNLGLYAHLSAAGIAHVTPRHEQGAGYAADGYARASGRPGVLITTTGPGVLNAAAALAQSWSDSIPVLVITPRLPDPEPVHPTGFLHESRDQTGTLIALLGNVRDVDTAASAREAVAEVFADFASARPRPWVIQVPLDKFDQVTEVAAAGTATSLTSTELELPNPLDADVVRAAKLLATARNGAVVVGGGAQGAAPEVRKLVAALGFPVVATVNGRGVVDERSPLSLSATLHLTSVKDWLRTCDVVLVLGSELAQSDTWTTDAVITGAVVRVDIDEAQRSLNSPDPAVFLHGAVAPVATALLAAVEDEGIRPASDGSSASLGLTQIDAVLTAAAAEVETLAARWLPLLLGLRAALPPDAILATDNAMCVYYGAHAGFPVYHPRSYLFPTGLGTLGYALPAAVGASVAVAAATAGTSAVARPVAVLSGDGGFQFTIAEMATARSLGRAMPIVVVDNGGYGEIRAEMIERGDTPIGIDAVGPDLVALAQAYDCVGVRLAAASNDPAVTRLVHDAVDVALTLDRPMIIVVREGK